MICEGPQHASALFYFPVLTFDFSTLYTSIPHDLLKFTVGNLVHNAFRKKDRSVRYTHIKVTRAKGYFTHEINGSGNNMYTADNICKIVEFLIDNSFVQFQPGYMTNVIILAFTLSIFHSFPATYHLALLMVYTFRSSSDVATSAWLIDVCYKAI